LNLPARQSDYAAASRFSSLLAMQQMCWRATGQRTSFQSSASLSAGRTWRNICGWSCARREAREAPRPDGCAPTRRHPPEQFKFGASKHASSAESWNRLFSAVRLAKTAVTGWSLVRFRPGEPISSAVRSSTPQRSTSVRCGIDALTQPDRARHARWWPPSSQPSPEANRPSVSGCQRREGGGHVDKDRKKRTS
jgi:hypothetical protein